MSPEKGGRKCVEPLTLLAVVAVLTGAKSLVAQEPPAYIVAAVTINDQDTYRQYQRGFGAILRQYEGELVAISNAPTILEGEWPGNLTVLLRFTSRGKALEWYNSDEYQELAKIRRAAATADFILINGRR